MVLIKGLVDQSPQHCLLDVLIHGVDRPKVIALLGSRVQKAVSGHLLTAGIPLSHHGHRLIDGQLLLQVGLVEEGHHHHVVANLEAETEPVAPVAKTGQEGLRHHLANQGHLLLVLGRLNIRWRQVIVTGGIIGQKISYRIDAEGRQVLGPLSPDPLQFCYRIL